MNQSVHSICLLRTSAIGDVTHVVPLVRTLQRQLPQAQLTWVVGKLEQRLVGDIQGVEFITFDKKAGYKGMQAVKHALGGRRFDVLLHMQVALRANLLSTRISAKTRIGYDKARSKDLHGLFINQRIAAQHGQHVLDALGSFVEPLGIRQEQVQWNIPISDAAKRWAEQHIHADEPTLVMSPNASHALRNWRPERYARIIDYAMTKGLKVILAGGPSPAERQLADRILSEAQSSPLDLTGKDTLKQALALFQRAHIVLTPDSGPMHMANAVGTKVLGLHAASNPDRSGPYSDRRWCVNCYAQAAQTFLHKPVDALPWGKKIEQPGVMDLITVDAVIERLDALCQHLGL